MSVHVTFVSMHVFTLDIWNSRRFDSLIFTFVSMHVFTLDIWNSRHFDSLIFTWGTKSCGWKHNVGSQKSWEISWIRDVSLEPSFANLARENFGNKNFSETWAQSAAFEARRGEPKVVVNSRDSRCVFGTFFVQLGPRKFWKRKFLKSMGTTQRWKHDAGSQKFCKISRLRGSSWDLCCCKVVFGTFFFEGRSAKILEPEISAKHGRHATFAAQHGEPKVVGNSPDSRCISGTFSVQLGPRKFWRRKFLKSMGATQRFACDAGCEGEVVAIYRSGIRCVCGAWGAKTLSTEKKGPKKKSREFRLLLCF